MGNTIKATRRGQKAVKFYAAKKILAEPAELDSAPSPRLLRLQILAVGVLGIGIV